MTAGEPTRRQPPPRVTVVTIFLDPGPYLEETIASVRSQTFADHEHVLVDDGSTDGSSELARAAAAADPCRVRYLEHPGHATLGMSRSRNAGMAVARGELLAFLDADDVWLPEALERQVRILDQCPEAAMVIGATIRWHSWAGNTGEDRIQSLDVRGLIRPPRLALERLHQRSNTPSMNAALARRQTVQAIGGFEAAFRGMYEDQAYFLKFFLAHPVVVHDEVIDRYRQHPNSAVAHSAAAGEYHPERPNPSRQAFRRFALEHVGSGPWRGTVVHREARWLHRWDRWPRLSRSLYRFRPGVVPRILRRLRRWRG